MGEHSISTPTSSFFPLLNQPGMGDTESSRVCFCFCLFNFFFHYYYEISIPSSSWWPYQYITVVFRNSLPSATEDTHKPRISQELTSCWWWWREKKRTKQRSGCDCRRNLKMLPRGLPVSAVLMWIWTQPDKINLATSAKVIKYHALTEFTTVDGPFMIYWSVLLTSERRINKSF